MVEWKAPSIIAVPVRLAGIAIDGATRLLSLFLIVIMALSIWATYKAMSGSQDRGFHVCKQCASRFKCRQKPIIHNGDVAPTAVRSRRGIATFQRRSVNIGKVPIEVAETAQTNCCATRIGADEHAFCGFNCYLRYAKKQTS